MHDSELEMNSSGHELEFPFPWFVLMGSLLPIAKDPV